MTFVLHMNLLLGQGLVGTVVSAPLNNGRRRLKTGAGASEGLFTTWMQLMLALGWDLTWGYGQYTYAWPFHVTMWLPHNVVAGFQG